MYNLKFNISKRAGQMEIRNKKYSKKKFAECTDFTVSSSTHFLIFVPLRPRKMQRHYMSGYDNLVMGLMSFTLQNSNPTFPYSPIKNCSSPFHHLAFKIQHFWYVGGTFATLG